MLPHYPNPVSTPPLAILLDGILNASLNGIIAYESIRDPAGQIIDFRAVTVNRMAQQILNLPGTEPGWLLLKQFPAVKEYGMFAQYIGVVNTAEPLRFETAFQNERMNGWYDVAVGKLGDGFVITFNDITAQHEATQSLIERNNLLDSILESSPSSIATFKTVRNEAGQVADFRFGMMNEKSIQDITRDFGVNPINRLLSEVSPDSRQTGQFNAFVQVLETGTPIKHEHFYPKIGLWYDTSIARIDGGIVVTATDITTEKQAIAATQKQNELLTGVLGTSTSTVIVYDAMRDEAGQIQDFRLKLANPAGKAEIMKHFNLDPVGRTLLEINSEARKTGQFDRYVEVMATGQSIRREHFFPNINAWYDTHVAQLGDGVVITATDVTAQKQAQQELERQTELIQTMLDGAINGVLLLSPIYDDKNELTDFTILAANPAAEKLTGIPPEKAIGQTMTATYPGYRDAGFFTVYRDAFLGQPGRTENYYEDENGLRGWFEVSAVRQADTLVLTFANTSNFRQAEQELKQAATDLQAVIDNSQTGIFVFSPVRSDAGDVIDFRFKAINNMVAALVGQTPDAIRGDLASNWFISYRETETYTRYITTLATGEEQRFDINYNVDGLDVWFDVRSVKLGDDVLVTFTDYTDLKQAQMAQEQQSDFLNSILNGTSNGIMVFEALRNETGGIVDLIITNANATGAGIANKPIDQLLGIRALANFPGIRETGLYDLYIETIDTGQPGNKELHYQADGLDVFVSVGTRKLGDGLVVTYNDISETRRLSLFAEQQASLLNSVLDGSINGIMSFKAMRDAAGEVVDFEFLTMNEASAQMVGKTLEDVTGKPLLSIFPGNVESGLFAKYVHTTNTGEPTRTEVDYRLDGLDFWLDISAQQLGDGFVVTFTDISVIKRAAQAIGKSAEELQTVIDMSQTGICLVSPVFNDADAIVDFRFRLANRALASFIDQPSSTAPGMLVSMWFPDYFQTGIFDRYKQRYEAGGRETFDFHYEGDGIDAWLSITAARIDHEILVTFSDFTALKKLQQQLEASVIDLQRSNKNLEQFAYVASHDLQEPLRKIQQFGDILQTSYAPVLDETGQDMLRRMQSAAERMRVLIKDVLAYSRIATKRESAKAIDLNKLLREVMSDLETAISKNNALIAFDTLPTVAGEAIQLRQLFQNLIGNALKFAKPDWQPKLDLRYTVQRGRDTGLPVSAADEARQFYRLELSDNGIGFEPHQAEKIFQVFQRLHNRNEYQGTGIGLAIVQKVIENHQGYIRAEGRPGEGATFTMLLPV